MNEDFASSNFTCNHDVALSEFPSQWQNHEWLSQTKSNGTYLVNSYTKSDKWQYMRNATNDIIYAAGL